MKPKLYVKLPNGRYEPYVEKKSDDRLYRKLDNGKYVPCEMNLHGTTLPDGVWVITKSHSCTSMANGVWLYDQYKCIKTGDIVEAPSLAELGGYQKLSEYLFQHWDEVDMSCIDTICKSVVGILMKYGKEGEK